MFTFTWFICAYILTDILVLLLRKIISKWTGKDLNIQSPEIKQYGLDSLPGGRLFAGIKAFFRVPDYISDGYEKYASRGVPFSVPNFFRGDLVFLPSSTLKDIKSAPSSEIDGIAALIDTIAFDRALMNTRLQTDPYHIGVIASYINKKMASIMVDLEDEITHGFAALIEPRLPDPGEVDNLDRWSIIEWDTLKDVVARAANRTFLGTSLCRDENFIKLAGDYTTSVITAGIIMGFFPEFLRPYIAPFVTILNRSRARRAVNMLSETITERLTFAQRPGGKDSEAEVPNDFLQALVNAAIEHGEGNVYDITLRLMIMNFASIHTTSNTFQNLLLNIASFQPTPSPLLSYATELYTELQAVYSANNMHPSSKPTAKLFNPRTTGWTYPALQSLVGLDSFILETLRLHFVNPGSVIRKVVSTEGYTLKSSGIHLPHGTLLAFGGRELNREGYEDPETFNGFRSSLPYQYLQDDIELEEMSYRYGFTPNGRKATSTEHNNFVSFGAGRHACLGRFYAVTGLKLLMKHVLLNYEVRLEGGRRERPDLNWFFLYQLPIGGRGNRIEIRRKDAGWK